MSSLNGLLEQLRQTLKNSEILLDKASLFGASHDNSRYSFMPDALVRIGIASDAGLVLKAANSFKIPVSVRGAGSGASAAALPFYGGIAIDLSALNNIEIDSVSWIATVGAGAICENINKAAEKFGLMYPPDPSSKKYSTIGGNIACNAGGLRAAKYGATRDYVMALEAYLPNGEFVRLSRPLRKYSVAMNLKDLMIGSEGTLGVITKAYLKLVPRPKCKATALSFFNADEDAFDCVETILKSGLMPSILEFMDADTVASTAAFTKQNIEKSAMLLIECDGSESEVNAAKLQAEKILKAKAKSFKFSASETDSENLWQMRRAASPAMYGLGKAKINQDIVLPLNATKTFFKFYKNLGKEAALPTPSFGHAADGNYHIHFMYNPEDKTQKAKAHEAMDCAIAKAVELGGAISGEHGIGIAKSRLLHLQISPPELAAMKAIKSALDPNNILNPQAVYADIDIRNYQPLTNLTLPWDK